MPPAAQRYRGKIKEVKPYIQTTVQPDFRASLKNIPGEQFSPERPDAVWVSDITYIWTLDGFVYLISIMDLYSRKIIAWELSTTLEAVHVADCVKKACPWDNACIESFHALIKREWLRRFRIFDYQHAYKLVFKYIETLKYVRIFTHIIIYKHFSIFNIEKET